MRWRVPAAALATALAFTGLDHGATAPLTSSAAPLPRAVANTVNPARQSTFIVQAASARKAGQLVTAAGGDVLRELAIINGVEAALTAPVRARLATLAGIVQVTADQGLVSLANKHRQKSSADTLQESVTAERTLASSDTQPLLTETLP